MRGAFVLALAVASPRQGSAQGWSGALGIGSDNIYRGISLTDGRPAWLADVHYDFDGAWLVGVSASAEHLPGQSAGAQLVAYLDRRWQFGDDWAAKAGIVHYDSPGTTHREYWRYDELTAALGYRGQWTASIAVSPNRLGPSPSGQGSIRRATSVELTFHQPLFGDVAGDAGVGYTRLDGAADNGYAYGSAGVSCGLGDARAYLLAVWTGSMTVPYERSTPARLRWVTSVVWSF